MLFVVSNWPYIPYNPGKNSSHHRTLIFPYGVTDVATAWTLGDVTSINVFLTQSQPWMTTDFKSSISNLQSESSNIMILVTRYESRMNCMVPGVFLHGYKAVRFKNYNFFQVLGMSFQLSITQWTRNRTIILISKVQEILFPFIESLLGFFPAWKNLCPQGLPK